MRFSLATIAAAMDADVVGNPDIEVTGAAEPASAGPDQIALAMSPAYAEGLAEGQARAAVLWDGADWESYGLEGAIIVRRPRYAMSSLTRLMDPGPEIAPGIHPTAIIDPSARIGADAAIGPFVVIGREVRIGARARIAAHASVETETRIGDDVMLLHGARIGARVTLGDRIIVHPGAVIGADGFSFVTPSKSGVEEIRETLGQRAAAEAQSWVRIHSLGGVEIGDDVEVGANSTIDRGTIRATRVGRGTKIDNLVMVAHNVQVGEDCLLCAQVGISGSTKVGNRVVLGGKVGVSDNIFIGDDVIAGGGTNIYTNAPAGRVLLGSPAVKMELQVEIQKALRRLPRLYRDVQDLKKAVPKPGGSD